MSIIFLLDKVQKGYKGLSWSYKVAFEKNNYTCHVVSFEINKRLLSAGKYFTPFKTGYLRRKQKEILKEVQKNDAKLFFVIKGIYLLPETIDAIKEMGKTIICFNPDDPFSHIAGSSNDNIKRCISHYDAYFIWHKKLVEQIRKAGCSEVFYLPFAADTDMLKPPRALLTPKYDVSFVGNADKERLEIVKTLAKELRDCNEPKALFGHGWKNIAGFNCSGPVLGNDFLNVIHSSKINLNLLRKQNKGSHNMRTFDIPAAGGFMLHEYSDEAVDFFKPGVEAEFFKDVAECADKIKYYCKNDNLRNKIAKSGYEKIFSAGYTYSHLAKQIEGVLKNHLQTYASL